MSDTSYMSKSLKEWLGVQHPCGYLKNSAHWPPLKPECFVRLEGATGDISSRFGRRQRSFLRWPGGASTLLRGSAHSTPPLDAPLPMAWSQEWTEVFESAGSHSWAAEVVCASIYFGVILPPMANLRFFWGPGLDHFPLKGPPERSTNPFNLRCRCAALEFLHFGGSR